MEGSETYPWDLEAQLCAGQERFAAVSTELVRSRAAMSAFYAQPVSAASPTMNDEFDPTFDELDFTLVPIGRSSQAAYLTEFDVTWHSPERNRPISTGEGSGFSLNTWVIEKALYNPTFGAGQMGEMDLNKFPLIDWEGSPSVHSLRVKPDSWKEKIYIPNISSRTMMTFEVDMSDFYAREGLVTLRSPFSEHILVPQEWLFTEDKEAESWIASKLGLSRAARLQAATGIRLSHRRAQLARMFSPESLPIIDVPKLIGALAGIGG